LPEANDDVDTVHYFAGNAEGKMLSGRTLQVLLGFRNSGETPQTVSQITGSLNSPKHFSLYVSNFSTATYNLVVEPGKETSFEYLLKVDPQLAGHDFTLALTVFYQDASDRYSSTFINATIPVFDPDASFDTQTIFMYMSLISLAFAATYVVLQATGGGENICKEDILGHKWSGKPCSTTSRIFSKQRLAEGYRLGH
jgi:hypothetical protein